MSTAQALRQWEAVIQALHQVKAFAAANPGQPIAPELTFQVWQSTSAASNAPTLPQITWEVLLQKKVST